VLSPTTAAFSPLSMASMGQRLRELGCSARLSAILSVPANLIGVPLHRCPAFLYYMTLASYLMSSWRLACSGTAMAEAFLSRFKSLGGEVVAGDGVEAVQIESSQASGAILQSGRILPAAAVIAAIHPKTIVSLLPPDVVRPSYARRVAEMADTKGLFGVNLAVDSVSHPSLPYNVYRLHAEADGALSRGIFCQLRRTGRQETNLLSMIAPSGIEDWQPWEGTISGKRGGDYEAAKEEKARDVIAEAEKLFGPLRNAMVLDTYTPLTIRDRVGSPGGSPYGILRSTDQLMKAASLNRAPLKGLFPAGQNRLSPGIMGTMLGSFQAVRQVVGHERFARDVAGGLR
jgi:all-trans-retinol 13,14-reductase